jgi:hypothetical protein
MGAINVEEARTLSLAVLHATPSVHRGRLDLDIRNPTGDIWGGKR